MANMAKPPCDEAVILANPCVEPSPTSGGWVIAVTILGSSMAFIDGTVVNVALPALQSALGATISEVQWVVAERQGSSEGDGSIWMASFTHKLPSAIRWNFR
jgi:hypothetical protein